MNRESIESRDVDIIIPVYNERHEVVSKTIGSVIDSIKNTVSANIIVVDDGSVDPYSHPCSGTASMVKVLRHESNKGYGR